MPIPDTFWFKRIQPVSLVPTNKPSNGLLLIHSMTFMLAIGLGWAARLPCFVPLALALPDYSGCTCGSITSNGRGSLKAY